MNSDADRELMMARTIDSLSSSSQEQNPQRLTGNMSALTQPSELMSQAEDQSSIDRESLLDFAGDSADYLGGKASDLADWAKENPVDAVAAGMMFVPGVGWAGGSIIKAAQLGYRGAQLARASNVASKLNPLNLVTKTTPRIEGTLGAFGSRLGTGRVYSPERTALSGLGIGALSQAFGADNPSSGEMPSAISQTQAEVQDPLGPVALRPNDNNNQPYQKAQDASDLLALQSNDNKNQLDAKEQELQRINALIDESSLKREVSDTIGTNQLGGTDVTTDDQIKPFLTPSIPEGFVAGNAIKEDGSRANNLNQILMALGAGIMRNDLAGGLESASKVVAQGEARDIKQRQRQEDKQFRSRESVLDRASREKYYKATQEKQDDALEVAATARDLGAARQLQALVDSDFKERYEKGSEYKGLSLKLQTATSPEATAQAEQDLNRYIRAKKLELAKEKNSGGLYTERQVLLALGGAPQQEIIPSGQVIAYTRDPKTNKVIRAD
tara:strand:- start:6811 stop:8307 length:1497 start_codon:yes stop_codon:yes gene_type:complete